MVHYEDGQYAATFLAFDNTGHMCVLFDGSTQPYELDGEEGVTLINDFDMEDGLVVNNFSSEQSQPIRTSIPISSTMKVDESSLKKLYCDQIVHGLLREGASEKEIAEVNKTLSSSTDETFDEKDKQIAYESRGTFYQGVHALQRSLGKVSSFVWCMLGSVAG
jgi:hypothetical protein